MLDRSAESLCGFVESTVAPGSLIVTDDWSGYAGLGPHQRENERKVETSDPLDELEVGFDACQPILAGGRSTNRQATGLSTVPDEVIVTSRIEQVGQNSFSLFERARGRSAGILVTRNIPWRRCQESNRGILECDSEGGE